MAIEITLDVSGLVDAFDRLVPEMDAAFETAMVLSMDLVALEARSLAPSRTGELVLSINAVPPTGRFSDGTLTGTVAAAAPHAGAMEDGAKPHVIMPRSQRTPEGMDPQYRAWRTRRPKRALRWASGGTGEGGWAFAKKVNHPGNAAKPFLKPALRNKRERIEQHFEKATRNAIRKAGLR